MQQADFIETDYQDVLRTLGRFVDEHGLSNIRLAETDRGFLLHGTVRDNGNGEKGEKEVCFLTAQEIRDMMLWS